MEIFLDKKISSNVKSVSIIGTPGVKIRQNDKYILGGSEIGVYGKADLNRGLYYSGNMVSIFMNVNTANKDIVNNDTVGIELTNLELKFN